MYKVGAHEYGARNYYFNKQEIEIINKFCQLAKNIAISEIIKENNIRYSANYLFDSVYDEYITDGTYNSYFFVSD